MIKINNNIANRNRWVNKIHLGDALILLKKMPSHSVDCVVTSPPYWALRDYGVLGQLGLEPTFEKYVTKLCDIFDEVKRVLKKRGTCFVNLSDTYAGSNKGAGYDGKNIASWRFDKKPQLKASVKAKSLCMIPSRFAIEMCRRGWILRNEIVWHKPNAMPSSVKDRFTHDFEKVFFFTQLCKYNFQQLIEPYLTVENRRPGVVRTRRYNYDSKFNNNPPALNSPRARTLRKEDPAFGHLYHPKGRNMRCVWRIHTVPGAIEHHAMYPLALCEIPIKAGSVENGIVLDPFMGAGTTALAALKLREVLPPT